MCSGCHDDGEDHEFRGREPGDDPAEAPLGAEDHEGDPDESSAESAEEHVAVQACRNQDIADERRRQTGEREGCAEPEEHGDLGRRLLAEQQ